MVDIYISLGSLAVGLAFGVGGLIFLAVGKYFGASWDARSLKVSATVGGLVWGLYELMIFMRYVFDYMFVLPSYDAVSLSLSDITSNPFIFGINPIGYLVSNPIQALVTWALELGGAITLVYLLGPFVTDE